MLHACGEPYHPTNAAFVLVRGAPTPLDVASVQFRGAHGRTETRYSFLAVRACAPLPWETAVPRDHHPRVSGVVSPQNAWGLTADVDVESERWRCLGGARFTVGALVRVGALRVYEGDLWYLPHPTPGGGGGGDDDEVLDAAERGGAGAAAGEWRTDVPVRVGHGAAWRA